MSTLTITLSDERMAKLNEYADRQGMTLEDVLGNRIDQLEIDENPKFREIAERVLKKNAELLRRLA